MTIYKDTIELINIALVAVLTFSLVIAYTKIVGLRSFAKMTSIDFATTIAIGSMIATVILPSKPSLVGGLFGIMMVYILQWSTSVLRHKSSFVSSLVENSPALIMQNGVVDHKMLKKVNMTEADLIGKLREANVFDPKKVSAVVFESTGDVSVLHSDQDLDDYLLSDLNN